MTWTDETKAGMRTQPVGARPVLQRSLTGAEGRVLLLVIDNPPLNGLTQAVRAELSEALTRELAQETAARPVVIAGAAGLFSAATLVEAGDALCNGAPSLSELCQQIDTYPAPVVAAVSGRAVGPGAELALACHARVMALAARMQFPEAGLGLPPMAGSSQRLPRLTGAEEALPLLLHARPVGGDQALAIGLADHVTEGDPIPAAIRLAETMRGAQPVIAREDGIRDVLAFSAAIAKARREEARNQMPAPARIIDCVEAALYLPPENGFALEAVIFEDLLKTSESQGLIAAARAERITNMLPVSAATAPGAGEEIRALGLTGTGPQLAALALLALGRGMQVIWVGAEDTAGEEAHLRITGWVRERLEAEVRSGRLSQAQRDSDLLRFSTGQKPTALGRAGLVVHGRSGAASDAMIRQFPAVSHLVIGGAAGRAGMTISPSGKACEISTGGVIGPQALAAIWRLMRSFGLQPVLSGGMPQIGRQVVAAGQIALARMMALGVPRRLIATALDGFGQGMPDLEDPEPAAATRGMAREEIVRRWLGAMANEGYRLIAQGSAPGPETVDFLLVQGYTFPRWQGGPMHQAAQRGPMVLRSDLRRWQEDDPVWTPHPALDQLVSKGRGVAAA